MLFKEIVDARTDARTHRRTTDDERRTLKDHKSSLSTSCSGELKKTKDNDRMFLFCFSLSQDISCWYTHFHQNLNAGKNRKLQRNPLNHNYVRGKCFNQGLQEKNCIVYTQRKFHRKVKPHLVCQKSYLTFILTQHFVVF